MVMKIIIKKKMLPIIYGTSVYNKSLLRYVFPPTLTKFHPEIYVNFKYRESAIHYE